MAEKDDDGFITLPPGIFDSGTFKLPPKAERPRAEHEEIVFVPTVPGMPPPAPVTAEVPVIAAPEAAPSAETVAPPEAIAPVAPPTAETPAVAPDVAWRLVLPDGREAVVRSAVLLGRNPAPVPAHPGAELVALADPTQSVSKTHAAFEADDSGLWVHDLDSTNGVWVVVGEDATEAVPGRRVQVPAGASVELGDYVLEVVRR